jgi:hypothetical protein
MNDPVLMREIMRHARSCEREVILDALIMAIRILNRTQRQKVIGILKKRARLLWIAV